MFSFREFALEHACQALNQHLPVNSPSFLSIYAQVPKTVSLPFLSAWQLNVFAGDKGRSGHSTSPQAR